MKVQGVDSFIPLQQDVKATTTLQPEGQSVGLPATKDQDVWQPEEKAKENLDLEKLGEAVGQANKTMETYSTELRFSIHKESGEIMVKVINTKDNSVIREIPPESVLNFVAHVKKMLGIIIDKFI